MDLHNANAYTRRAFLQRGVTLASAAVTVPFFLQKSALAMARPQQVSSVAGVPDERILVVVQLSGGNDGLNTVIPFRDDTYYRVRNGIAIPPAEVLTLDRRFDIGLHPRLEGMKSLWDDGNLAIVQGTGYPNPNRSHFTSMDIWHTADTSGVGEGWLGRFFDNQCHGSPAADAAAAARNDAAQCAGEAGIALGREAPLAMQGRQYKPISFETPDMFRWTGEDLHPALVEPYDEILHDEPGHDQDIDSPEAAFLTRTAMDARVASDRIRQAMNARPLVDYPGSGLARQLAMVGSMIRADLQTRVFYVSMGGFDTHRGQGGANGSHANLMRQLGDALRAFQSDLKAQGNDGRVLTMVFSEFGRRVGQNASNGTDHGTAAPMFLVGPTAKAGVHGGHPSLRDLDQGDLKYHTDFRTIYAAVLGTWLGANPDKVLDNRYRPADVINVPSADASRNRRSRP